MSDDDEASTAKRMVGFDGSANVSGEEIVIVPGDSLAAKADGIAQLLTGLRESVNNLEVRHTETDDRATRSDEQASSARRTAMIVAGFLLLVAGFTAVIAYVAIGNRSTVSRLDTQQQCQADFNNRTRDALIALEAADAAERAAQRELLAASGDTLSGPQPTPEQRSEARRKYVEQLVTADQRRATARIPTGSC